MKVLRVFTDKPRQTRILGQIGILKCRFHEERKIGVPGRKHEREEGVEEKNQQQTQPDYEAEFEMLA